jgi:hypothetical protein
MEILRRQRQKVMKRFSELKKSFQKRLISKQIILINMCETYIIDLLSKPLSILLFEMICKSCCVIICSWLFSDFGVPKGVSILSAAAFV